MTPAIAATVATAAIGRGEAAVNQQTASCDRNRTDTKAGVLKQCHANCWGPLQRMRMGQGYSLNHCKLSKKGQILEKKQKTDKNPGAP